MHYESIDINNMTDEVKEHVTRIVMNFNSEVSTYCDKAILNAVFNYYKNDVSPEDTVRELIAKAKESLERIEYYLLDKPTFARMINVHIKLEKEISEMRRQYERGQ